MQQVTVTGRCTGTPAEIWERLCRLEDHARALESVYVASVVDVVGSTSTVDWEVDLRGSRLRWRQQQQYLADEHTLKFEQIEGDLSSLAGQWSVITRGGHCFIQVEITFEIGIRMLREMLEPIAADELRSSLDEILQSLGRAEIEGKTERQGHEGMVA